MALGRYVFTDKHQDKDTKNRVKFSTIYPKVNVTDNDIYIYTKQGDRLDLLAKKYYNDVNMWWVIAQANHLGKGSMNIKPATKLRIPQGLDQVFGDLETLNTVR